MNMLGFREGGGERKRKEKKNFTNTYYYT